MAPRARPILGSAHGGFCRFCVGSRRWASPGRDPSLCSRRAPLPRRLAASVAVPRQGAGGGDRPDPGTPASEVCTCLQNLTTFLPRRTPLWSDILRATKLRSPPWTLVPTANNLVSVILSFCDEANGPVVRNLASRPHWAAGEPLRTWVEVESGRRLGHLGRVGPDHLTPIPATQSPYRPGPGRRLSRTNHKEE